MNADSTTNQIDERILEQLCLAIKNYEVVPIIGNTYFSITDSNSGEEIPIIDYLIKEISQRFPSDQALKLSLTDISEQIEFVNMQNYFRRSNIPTTDIYYEIHRIVKSISGQIHCHPLLQKFLEIGKFPIVVSVSFIPGLENLIPNAKVVEYRKDAKNDIEYGVLSASQPTIYYLFGKSNPYKKSFMVTEDDFLEYIHLWHDYGTRPKKLSDYLKDKVLLVLGCDYPDWIFRFFWHSVRNFSFESNTQGQDIVAFENYNNVSLTKFLSRAHTQYMTNGSIFLDELLKYYRNEEETCDISSELISPVEINEDTPQNCDLFISYYHEDIDIANNIAEIFRDLGASVWLDKSALEPGDDFKRKIKSAIGLCNRFIPVLSQNAIKQDRSFFRTEWYWAILEAPNRHPLPYICPIIIDDLQIGSPSIKNRIPEELTNAHTHFMNFLSPTFLSDAKTLIRSFRKL